MSLLTDDDRRELCAGHYNSPDQFIDAIIAATIAKLAQGVSVEPVRYHPNYEAVISEYVEDYEMIGEDGQGRDCGYTPNENEKDLIKDAFMGFEFKDVLDIASALAAARVAENERLACEFDKLYTLGGDEIGPAIRALIGGNHG